MFGFIQAWNEFMITLTLMDALGHQTCRPGCGTFKTPRRRLGPADGRRDLITIPVVVFVLAVLQGRIATGLSRRRGQGLSERA